MLQKVKLVRGQISKVLHDKKKIQRQWKTNAIKYNLLHAALVGIYIMRFQESI